MSEGQDRASQLQWWIMAALLSAFLMIGGFMLNSTSNKTSDIQRQIEIIRAEITTFSGMVNMRNERLTEAQVRVSTIEAQIKTLESKIVEVQPQIPMINSQIAGIHIELGRIADKLDKILQSRVGK